MRYLSSIPGARIPEPIPKPFNLPAFTATITTVLLKRACETSGCVAPNRCGRTAAAGRIGFTLRMPARIQHPESWSSPISTRTAIEAMPGCIAVVDARASHADLRRYLCARMVKRGLRR
jgi:hypothetical protein